MTENQYLTVKEFSEKAGVTQQAIYKQLNARLKPFIKRINKKLFIDSRALEEFYNAENATSSTTGSTTDTTTEELIKMLQSELDKKNEQIHDLTENLKQVHDLLDQQQKLNAMDKAKILELEQKNAEAEEAKTEKHGLFSWFK